MKFSHVCYKSAATILIITLTIGLGSAFFSGTPGIPAGVQPILTMLLVIAVGAFVVGIIAAIWE